MHCVHGLHRTGSLITLWIALTLAGGDFLLGAGKPEDLTMSSWIDRLTEAWNLWADKRQLSQATAEAWSRRDFAAESWNAMLEFWQEMPMERVTQMIDQLRRHARNAHQRAASSGSGSGDLHARLSIGGASSSSTSVQSVQSQHSQPPIVLKPRPKPRLTAAPPKPPMPTRDSAPILPLSPKQLPAVKAKAMPKAMPKPSVSPQQAKQPAEQPSVLSVQSQQSEQSAVPEQLRKKPRGSAAVEVPGADRGEAWVPGRDWQAGDWRCRACNNHNWRRRGYCNGNGGRCGEPRGPGFGPKDWYCRCGNWNLGGRSVCNRSSCKTPRSEGEQRR